eukprot:1775613-Pleurochrysis_carterae.AAC.1
MGHYHGMLHLHEKLIRPIPCSPGLLQAVCLRHVQCATPTPSHPRQRAAMSAAAEDAGAGASAGKDLSPLPSSNPSSKFSEHSAGKFNADVSSS